MKRLFTLMALFGFAASLGAASFVSQPLIPSDVRSLCVSNTINVTNLLSTTITTNAAGTIWTNYAGTRVIHSTSATTGNKNLFRDVDLWAGSDGNAPHIYNADTANVNATNSILNANIFIRLVGGSGANSAVQFCLVPLPDGVHESTVTADRLLISVTANTTTEVTSITPIPAYKWPGVAKIRCKWVNNSDTDASSRVDILDFSLNGFIP
jgi:hypothetical protein